LLHLLGASNGNKPTRAQAGKHSTRSTRSLTSLQRTTCTHSVAVDSSHQRHCAQSTCTNTNSHFLPQSDCERRKSIVPPASAQRETDDAIPHVSCRASPGADKRV
jgi:hypothetical protein